LPVCEAERKQIAGMVVKSQSILKLDGGALTNTTTLISVKEEPIDASILKCRAITQMKHRH